MAQTQGSTDLGQRATLRCVPVQVKEEILGLSEETAA